MILDTMKNHQMYHCMHEKFAEAFAFIEKAVAQDLPVDRYELDGKALYAFIQSYDTRPLADGKMEGHQNYIDIQYVISGRERIDLVDISRATPKTDYNPEKDVQFYTDDGIAGSYQLEAGDYGIFFPHDLHKPCLRVAEEAEAVKKIVVKIAL